MNSDRVINGTVTGLMINADYRAFTEKWEKVKKDMAERREERYKQWQANAIARAAGSKKVKIGEENA